jgi:hypothetical protein
MTLTNRNAVTGVRAAGAAVTPSEPWPPGGWERPMAQGCSSCASPRRSFTVGEGRAREVPLPDAGSQGPIGVEHAGGVLRGSGWSGAPPRESGAERAMRIELTPSVCKIFPARRICPDSRGGVAVPTARSCPRDPGRTGLLARLWNVLILGVRLLNEPPRQPMPPLAPPAGRARAASDHART